METTQIEIIKIGKFEIRPINPEADYWGIYKNNECQGANNKQFCIDFAEHCSEKRMNITQINTIRAEFLTYFVTMNKWQNELKAIVLEAVAKGRCGGTCAIGQAIKIQTSHYQEVLEFPYGMYYQSDISDEALKPLMNEMQEFCDRAFPKANLQVRHDIGRMD